MSKQDKNQSVEEERQQYLFLGDLFKIRKELRTHHKILYIALVFIGINLCWFGVWTTIATTPILQIPAVAAASGVVLLLITGKIKDLT